MNDLINFDALGDVFINLTNKLSEGVGWIVNRETPNKLAVDIFIKDIQESEYDPVTKAALISNAKRLLRNTVIKIIL